MVEKRLSARLVKKVDLLGAFPSMINADRVDDGTATGAFYRLVEMPAESAVKVRNILAPHRERSIERVCGQRTVLAIQDGTDLNFATRPGNYGPEVVGTSRKGAKSLRLHVTLAVTDSGLPLGVLRLGFDSTKARPPEVAARRSARRLLDGFTDIAKTAREVNGGTRVIAVCDLEADCFEIFDAQRRHPRVDLLARVSHDRESGKNGQNLSAQIGGAADGLIDVEIEELAARPGRRKRLACCEMRVRRVAVPTTRPAEDSEPTKVSAVHVETEPPDGENPVQWDLLTSLDVRSAEDAAKAVGFYLQRWQIMNFFRVLKSGCRAEFLQFRTADRLHRAVAINSSPGASWLTLLGHQMPDCEEDIRRRRAGFPAVRRRMACPNQTGSAQPSGRRPSWRISRPKTRSSPRTSSHVARPDNAGKRSDGPPDWLQSWSTSGSSKGKRGFQNAGRAISRQG